MNLRLLLLHLCCGAFGGYIAGARFPRLTSGAVGDLCIGIVGGGIVGHILQREFAAAPYSSELSVFLSGVFGGCLGGALLVFVFGSLRAVINKH